MHSKFCRYFCEASFFPQLEQLLCLRYASALNVNTLYMGSIEQWIMIGQHMVIKNLNPRPREFGIRIAYDRTVSEWLGALNVITLAYSEIYGIIPYIP